MPDREGEDVICITTRPPAADILRGERIPERLCSRAQPQVLGIRNHGFAFKSLRSGLSRAHLPDDSGNVTYSLRLRCQYRSL